MKYTIYIIQQRIVELQYWLDYYENIDIENNYPFVEKTRLQISELETAIVILLEHYK